MGVFSTIRHTIVAVAQPIISAANAVDESLTVATEAVHVRAVAHKLTDKHKVGVETSRTLNELNAELKANPDLQAMYESIIKEFD